MLTIAMPKKSDSAEFAGSFTTLHIILEGDMALPFHSFLCSSTIKKYHPRMSLLECREKSLCIHLGPHHVLIHEEDVINKKTIMSDPMFEKLPKSLRLIGLGWSSAQLVVT